MDKNLEAIWKSTHRDYKGVSADGERSILVLRNGGTCSVPLSTLTEEEVRRLLPKSARN